MNKNKNYFTSVLNLILISALALLGYQDVSAKQPEAGSKVSGDHVEAALIGFNKSTPADGASISMPASSLRLLQWTDAQKSSTDRYQYCIDQTNNDTCDSGVWVNRDSLYSGGPGDIPLEYGKTYYWQVRVRDANVYANGSSTDWWSFTITGSAPTLTKTTPANGATIALPSTVYYLLQWSNIGIASTDRYQYCIDDTNDNTCAGNNWFTRNSLYSGTGEFNLVTGKTYYWQVRTRDSGIYADSNTWHSFSISGSIPTFTKISPAAAVASSTSTYYLLQWTNPGFASTDRFQYCIDTTNNSLCDANNWILRNSLYSGPGDFTLTPGATYYWQVRSRDTGTEANSGVWSSFSVSGSPTTFQKTNPASPVAYTASTYYLLQWNNPGFASTDRFQYCIDTTANNLCDANNWILRNSWYSGPGDFTLTPGVTYYWQVRSRDTGTEADSGTWATFTVSGTTPVFEKTTPANGASVSHNASTYYLLQWTNFNLASTDRYQYCIDTTNNNACDSNYWITRNSLYSGPGDFGLSQGTTYYWQVRSRDTGAVANGGTWWSFTVPAVLAPPSVTSIVRTTPVDATTDAASVTYTITFSQAVTGVDASDFALTTTGVTGASITGVAGTDNTDTRTITINTGTGDGTIRLDVVDNDSILNNQTTPLGGAGSGNGSFTSGEVYTIDKP